MARLRRIRRFQIENQRVEKKEPNSRDFNELSIAIALLAGLSAFLLKLIDYFNNHIIIVSDYFQIVVYLLVGLLLFEILIIFSFLISKGLLIVTKNKENLVKISKKLFQIAFEYPIYWGTITISVIFLDYLILQINHILLILYIVVAGIVVIWAIKDKLVNKLVKINQNIKKMPPLEYYQLLIILPIVFFILINLFAVAPSYLLMGSFSIEEPLQININNDIVTFVIKETGMTYSANYISLSKINANGSTFLQSIDNIKINSTQEAFSMNMHGIRLEPGVWYLNVNFSNLTSGNYLLHAEVTNDLTKNNTIFGVVKKSDDKLFYVAPKGSLNST